MVETIEDQEIWLEWNDQKTSWVPPHWPSAKSGKIAIRNDAESLRALAKRAHDVTAGLRTLRFAIDSLKEGYRFDDAIAPAKIGAMEKAITHLEKESALLSQILEVVFQKNT